MAANYATISDVAQGVPFNNSTNGYTATNVQAAIEESNKHLLAIEVSDTSSITAPVGTDAVMTTMTITASPGTYIVWFSCDVNVTTAGAAVSVSLYNNGTQIPETLRKIVPFDGGALSAAAARGVVAINKIVTITTGALDVRWSVSSATATAAARTLNLLRVT